jgi:hypothetical protein
MAWSESPISRLRRHRRQFKRARALLKEASVMDPNLNTEAGRKLVHHALWTLNEMLVGFERPEDEALYWRREWAREDLAQRLEDEAALMENPAVRPRFFKPSATPSFLFGKERKARK